MTKEAPEPFPEEKPPDIELPNPLIVDKRSTPRKPTAPKIQDVTPKPIPLPLGLTEADMDRLWEKYKKTARACGSWEPDARRPDWRPE